MRENGDGTLLPASSIKGVIRTTSERILRSLHPDRPPSDTPLADTVFGLGEEQLDLFQGLPRSSIADMNLNAWREANSHQAFDPWALFGQLSPASQVFGATLHAGLVQFEDVVQSATQAIVRPHVSIDRFSGAVGNLFEEGVNHPKLLTLSLTITNFALWHFGLLHLVLREMERGYVGFGAGTHKGQGRMLMTTTDITFTYPAAVYLQNGTGIISAQGWLSGHPLVGADVPDAVADERDLTLLPQSVPLAEGGDWRDEGMVTVKLITADTITELYREAFLRAWLPWLQRMEVPIA